MKFPYNRILVKTFQGLEEVLEKEMLALGARNTEIHIRAVECDAGEDTELIQSFNLHLRTAVRVYLRLFSGKANNFDNLYREIKAYPWEDYIRPQDTMAIQATCYSDIFNHSHFTQLKVKDAIADRIREAKGRRPNVNLVRPTYNLYIIIKGIEFEMYLDTSGEPLFKRGYKREGAPAPLNEVMSAGLVQLSGWQESGLPFYDPMCGSGTLPVEAAMLQNGIPPGLWREHFGFMEWPDWDRSAWEKMKAPYEDISPSPENPPIYAADISRDAVRITRSNAQAAGVRSEVRVSAKDFFKSAPPCEEGMIITNPPYDKRFAVEDSVAFYQKIADQLKKSYSGWQAWIFSGQLEGMKHFGLKPSKKLTMMNGNIPCKFNKYELFKGKRNEHLKSE